MATESGKPGGPVAENTIRRLEGGARIPEVSANNGGRYGRGFSGVPLPASRTEHILSCYRPIAPKPVVIKPGESAGSAPSDPQSSSTLSFERTSVKANSLSSDGSRGKRTRKRAGTDSLLSPRGSKRASLLPNVRPEKLRTVSCKSTAVVGGIEKAVEQFSPDNGGYAGLAGPQYVNLKESQPGSFITKMAPSDTPAQFAIPGHGVGVFSREKYGSSFGAIGRKNPRPQLVELLVGSLGVDVSPREAPLEKCLPSGAPSERDSAAFMERAALSTPVFSGRSVTGFQKAGGYPGDYTHLRGGSSNSGSIPRPYSTETSGATVIDGFRSTRILEGNFFPSTCNSHGESEVTSGEGAESRKANLVTLSLLPNTPSVEHTSSEVSVPKSNLSNLRLAMGINSSNWDEDVQHESAELTLFSRSGTGAEEEVKRPRSAKEERENSRGRRSYSSEMVTNPAEGRPLLETLDKDVAAVSGCTWDTEENNECGRERIVDTSYMEQAYFLSSDPLMLTDEDNKILWSNQAFRRANTERSSGKDKDVVGPYIDPLGIPTQLSSFIYQPSQGLKIRAILWGFLKKFMMLETSGGSLLSEERDIEYGSAIPDRKFPSNHKAEVAEGLPMINHTVIAPQPIRPVGSTLTVGCITRNNPTAPPMTDNLESVKEQLELAPLPAIITDYKDRVRYMNAAYKQMVGQPECPWLAFTVGKKASRENAQHSRLTGEVVLTCKDNLAQLGAAFSCRVLVQWINQGKGNTIIVPCEVSRLENDRAGPMYVWKLDIASIGLRLQNGALRQDSAQVK